MITCRAVKTNQAEVQSKIKTSANAAPTIHLTAEVDLKPCWRSPDRKATGLILTGVPMGFLLLSVGFKF
jgi:hypothetical protein